MGDSGVWNGHKHLISFNLENEIQHGIEVSKLAKKLGRETGLDESLCYELSQAGMLHDIGKLRLEAYIEGEKDSLVIEEIKYVRMHSQFSFEIVKEKGYSDFILDSIHYHHENYDGTGYPAHLRGEEIPIGARILRVCDVFCALTSNRPYRKAFDRYTAIELMIDEVKNFDIKLFLAFQRVIHDED